MFGKDDPAALLNVEAEELITATPRLMTSFSTLTF